MQHLIDFAQVVADVFRSTTDIRRRPNAGGFSLVEHAWHLADLETEGYGERITRLLTEPLPHFADFRGDLIAEQRRYIEQPIEPAIARFVAQRVTNVERLRSITDAQWQLRGTQEGIGEVTLARIAEMMSEHDRSHAREIAELLREIGLAVPDALARFANDPPLRRTA